MDERYNGEEQTSPLMIFADDREAGAGVIEALDRMSNVEVCVRRLKLGDYEVDGRLLFERKTLRDLTISIVDGRLFSQMKRMVHSPERAVLVLEGVAGDLHDSGVSREAIQGALISIGVIFGIPVLRSTSPEETAKLLIFAARQMRSQTSGATLRHGYRPKGMRKRRIFILQGLPGIGPKRAAQLLETFGSIEAVMRASAKELAGVSGIGVETAEKIRTIVGESPEIPT